MYVCDFLYVCMYVILLLLKKNTGEKYIHFIWGGGDFLRSENIFNKVNLL